MSSKENLPFPAQLDALVQSAIEMKVDAVPQGHWMFYKNGEPRRQIEAFHKAFKQLRSNIDSETATLLDCGSGNGVAATVARAAEFQCVYGIEKSGQLHQSATQRLAKLVKAGIVPDNSVFLSQGSYYDQRLSPTMVDNCVNLTRRLHADASPFDPCNKIEFVAALLDVDVGSEDSVEDVVADYLFTPQRNIVDAIPLTAEGLLRVDVVYIYPSDLFFEDAFLPQMGRIMQPGSLLAILNTPHDQVRVSTNHFEEARPILIQSSESPKTFLQVFRKS